MLGIIIPHYKNKDQLKKCQDAISKQDYHDIMVNVQDNTDDNKGFTKACNTGIKELFDECDYFVILNQDCYLKEDAITKMVAFMKRNPKCGIAGVKQLHAGNPDSIIHGGCTQAFPHGRHLGGRVSQGDCVKDGQMPWVNGACLITRKSTIIDIGLMDENFVLICSDSDWCYTARQRGWQVWYIADAECLHEQGVSLGSQDEKMTTQMKLDTLSFREKWVSAGNYRELSREIF